MARPAIERFWEKVNKDGPIMLHMNTPCWVWTGTTNRKVRGYGTLKIKDRHTYVHRFSYVIHKGPIGKNLQVLHECDNSLCVNPNHLKLGTIADNARERSKRGPGIKGWKQMYALSKPTKTLSDLSRLDIETILERYTAIAKDFDISLSDLRKITGQH